VHTRKPEEVPWGALGVDYLAEASGVFLTAEGAEPHVKVIVCVLCVCVCACRMLACISVCMYLRM
jgi:glyceraldehyde-3-phosphate dehydrogenase/erythrose-4-phosphate dehydrogenase